MKIIKLIKMLEDTLEGRFELAETIKQIQQIVWDAEDEDLGGTERSREILYNLAYDLDFFVANKELRREDPSFYGEKRALEEIKNALTALRAEENG